MYKLLIVEDEKFIQRGLVQAIDWKSIGFEVIAEAENGKKALQCVEIEKPDVILTDIRMPVMDGLELMSIVYEQYPHIKLVVLSGYGDFSYAQHAIKCGVLGYILKPTKDEEIYQVFRKVKAIMDGGASPSVSKVLVQKRNTRNPVIERVEKFIDESFSEKITLENVAAIAYMNPTYFSTFFKQHTGYSFKDYLTKIRMEKARELILTTDLKAYHIAVMVGYDDSRYFSKLLKSTIGMSLSELRKEHRQ